MKSQLGLNADLPVMEIVKEAVELLWQKRRDVIRMFLPAVFLLAAIDWAGQYFFPQDAQAEQPVFHPEQLLFVVASLMLSILMATACHRFTLLPREQWNTNALHGFGRNEFSYLLRIIQIGVVTGVVLIGSMMLLMAVTGSEGAFAAGAVAVMIGLYFGSRLSITLPEMALGQKSSLGRAWQMSRGNGSKLVLVVFIVPVMMTMPFILLMFGNDTPGLLSYLAAFGTYITTLISLVMLSLSYRFLLEFYEPDDGRGSESEENKTLEQQERNNSGSFDA